MIVNTSGIFSGKQYRTHITACSYPNRDGVFIYQPSSVLCWTLLWGKFICIWSICSFICCIPEGDAIIVQSSLAPSSKMRFTLYRGGWLFVIGIEIQENQFLWSHSHTSFSVKWDLWTKIMLCWILCRQIVLMFSGAYDRTITFGSAWCLNVPFNLLINKIGKKYNS